MSREMPQQAGNNHPTSIPTGVFATADGHIDVAVAGHKIWERFCRVMGREDWMHPGPSMTGESSAGAVGTIRGGA